MKSLNEPINARAQNLLVAVVDRYIRDGQPVASKALAEEMALGISSATIRNVLAELEEHGYLASPHTSAGRIPTAQGYRFFVNSLLTSNAVSKPNIKNLAQQLNSDLDESELVTSASNMLSELTKLVGLVMLPRRESLILHQIEFLPLSENRILVILVLNKQEIQNRIITTDRTYSAGELQQAANYLNSLCAGQEISQMRTHLVNSLQEERQQFSQLLDTTLDVAEKVANKTAKKSGECIIVGQNNLFELSDIANFGSLKQLFEAFTKKQDILHLLDQSLNAQGVQIFIGEESGYDLFDECSLVTAPYSVEDEIVGALGVIGPTRMPYREIIPMVDITAKLLSLALNPVK